MNPADFRALLARSGMTQTELMSLAGLSLTAVNRYCSLSAADRMAVPRVVVALVVAWSLCSPRQQASIRARLAEFRAAEMVLVWSFQSGWALKDAEGSITGWTKDVSLAGRWHRDQAPEEFATVMVADPHWPAADGVKPIDPVPPTRPPVVRKRKRRPARPAEPA